ncbi:MAG TPA: hypothetical protein DHV88_11475 [Roseburia sp.]|nr:hypothetical protein [Roseburia sp.]
MMIKELFAKNMESLLLIPEIVEDFRRQMFFMGTTKMSTLLQNINETAEYILIQKEQPEWQEELVQILPALLHAQENQDYILQADILEGDVLPLLQKVQLEIQQGNMHDRENYYAKNVDVLKEADQKLCQELEQWRENPDYNFQQKYRQTSAINGQLSMQVVMENKTFCLHSSVNPEWEAERLVTSLPTAKNYVVWGIGLGYHVIKLLEAYPDCHVTVLESEVGLIFKTLCIWNLSEYIKNNHLRIVYSRSIEILLNELKQQTVQYELLLYYPAIQTIENEKIKGALEDFFVTTSSMREQRKYLDYNFDKLDKENLPDCGCLKDMFYKKNVVIVGAGPSVDSELDAIRKYRSQLMIFATGHIVRKLIAEQIEPDAIIITDSQPHMYEQIKGLNIKIPLILLSTASASVYENYSGPVYIAYQKGYEPAEEKAEILQVEKFETGGSVTTTALDVAIRFDAAKIILVGVDLAYTNGYSHAEGVGRKIKARDGLRTVKDCNGNEIFTSKNLDIYRKWIEYRLERGETIKVYNTGKGAKIKGTYRDTWENILKKN